MTKISMTIDGMHCGACVRRVTQALAKVEGVEVEEVRIGAARIKAAEAASVRPALIAALEKAGYPAHVEN